MSEPYLKLMNGIKKNIISLDPYLITYGGNTKFTYYVPPPGGEEYPDYDPIVTIEVQFVGVVDQLLWNEKCPSAPGDLLGIKFGMAVTEITANLSYVVQNMTGIHIPSSVESIGPYVFANTAFGSINGLSGVKHIGNYAFYNCQLNYLWDINLSNLITIGTGAFSGSNITSIDIPSSVTNIDYGSFCECLSLNSVTLGCNPSTDMFANCINLSTVNILEGVTNISEGMFYGCSNLSSIIIPSSIVSIGAGSFLDSGLLDIVFKGNAPLVNDEPGYPVFTHDPGMTNCTAYVDQNSTGWGEVPSNNWNGINIKYYTDSSTTLIVVNITQLNNYAYIHNVTRLDPNKSIIIDWGDGLIEFLTSIYLKTHYYSSTGEYTVMIINANSIQFGYYKWEYNNTNPSLKSVRLGYSITSIPDEAFYKCRNLNDVTIPSSVTSIGRLKFITCTGLTSVTFLGRTLEQVQLMTDYPWGISDTSIIRVS